MPQGLPVPTSTGVNEGTAKELDSQYDGAGHRRRSLLQNIQRFSPRKRRDEDGKFPDTHDEEITEDTQTSIGPTASVRRRSLLRRIPQKWRGKSGGSRAPGHRRLKSEERPVTPSLVPHYELELNARKRAVSETRQVVVQNSRRSSATRTNSATRRRFNGGSSRPRDPSDVQHQFSRFRLDDTAEDAEPEEEILSHPDQFDMLPINVIDGRPSSRASSTETIDKAKLSEELDSKWILNLSMQFRDDSRQEKLFITYAEKPNFWRRVTVTWDYRHLRRGSMEEDLRTLTLQRDKNMRVYESLRVSLADIKFFDTITNLKLKTENDDRLHIYVAEDVDEIIDYPLIGQAEHIRIPRFKEREVLIDAHLSGFVYKVRAGEMVCVKKEIPGPNNVDEFMYELNALNMLSEEKGVIDFEGIVTDDSGELIKGLLISFASRGSLAELIYEFNGSLRWSERKKWAGQIIEALSAVHETGFVQGDFTLSNVVIDEQQDAHIIDLNRRGCPIGWEPPELMEMILSKQKIAMMISTKTDLYQLGMVLYALAEQVDEPDRLEHEELYELNDPSIPAWYRSIVQSCLESDPRKRKSALVLSAMFKAGAASDPDDNEDDTHDGSQAVDPSHVVTHDDIAQHREMAAATEGPESDYYQTPSGQAVLRPSRRSYDRGRSSVRYPPPSSSHTSVEDDFVTPAQEGPPSVAVIQLGEPDHVSSPKTMSLPSPSVGRPPSHHPLSIPALDEDQRSASKVSDPRSAQLSQRGGYSLQHQDSGLPDMETEVGQRLWGINHQDSGFDDMGMSELDDENRFMLPERRGTGRDEVVRPSVVAARVASGSIAGASTNA